MSNTFKKIKRYFKHNERFAQTTCKVDTYATTKAGDPYHIKANIILSSGRTYRAYEMDDLVFRLTGKIKQQVRAMNEEVLMTKLFSDYVSLMAGRYASERLHAEGSCKVTVYVEKMDVA